MTAHRHETVRHETVHVEVGDMDADIDVGIAPLIEEIWRAEIVTINSCQEAQPGVAGIVFLTAEHAEAFLDIVAGEFDDDDDSLYNRILQARSADDEDQDGRWIFIVDLHDESLDWQERPDGTLDVRSTGSPHFGFSISIGFPVMDIPVLVERMRAHNEAATTTDLGSPTEQTERQSESERPPLPESYKIPRPTSDAHLVSDVVSPMFDHVDQCRGEEVLRRTLEIATPGQRSLYNCHLYMVMTLGEDHFTYLRSYAHGCEDALRGFEMMGAQQHREILAQALSVFPNSIPPKKVQERERYLDEADSDLLKELDDRLQDIEDDYHDLATQYILAHPEEFFVDP